MRAKLAEHMAANSLTGEAQLATEESGEEADETASAAEPGADEGEKSADSGTAQIGAGAAPFVEPNVRFRGRVLDEAGDLGDPSISSFSPLEQDKDREPDRHQRHL